MKKTAIFLLLPFISAILCSMTHAQEISQNKLRERIIWQNEHYPQEIVHVTTDKELYLSGDTVWMRPFIVDGMTHRPVNRSRFLYVDLIDQQDSIHSRIKLHRNPEENDSIMQGYLPLDITLPSGSYTIAAYTQWMTNTSEHYFFKKNISIINPKDILDQNITQVMMPYNGADHWHYADISYADDLLSDSSLFAPAQIITDQPVYAPRHKATVTVKAPANTTLVASVTDNGFNLSTPTPSISGSIFSMPYIHSTDELIKGHIRIPNIPFEDAETISGKVVSLFLGRPLPDVNIGIIAPQIGYADVTVTDQEGNFTFNDIDMPDGTVFCIRSYNEKQKSRGYIEFPASPIPAKLHHLAAPQKEATQQTIITEVGFVDHIRNRMEYNHGMWQMLLNEVEVITSYRKKVKESDAITYVKRFDSDYIRDNNITTIDELLMRIPGVRTTADNAYYRRATLQFVIDNVQVEPIGGMTPYSTFMQICPFEWIESVELLNAMQSLMYTPASNSTNTFFNERSATIRVKTKSVVENSTFIDHYIIRPLGHQPHISFRPLEYKQQGIIDNSDQRATLYWNPVLTTDSEGNASFEFYTNDARGTTLSISVEGITQSGQIISQKVQVKTE